MAHSDRCIRRNYQEHRIRVKFFHRIWTVNYHHTWIKSTLENVGGVEMIYLDGDWWDPSGEDEKRGMLFSPAIGPQQGRQGNNNDNKFVLYNFGQISQVTSSKDVREHFCVQLCVCGFLGCWTGLCLFVFSLVNACHFGITMKITRYILYIYIYNENDNNRDNKNNNRIITREQEKNGLIRVPMLF